MIALETLAATVAEREREIAGLTAVREAQRAARPPERRRREGWAWRVEPGMEEVFASPRGWLLSRAGGDTAEYLPRAAGGS
jgi:hypothetical protein